MHRFGSPYSTHALLGARVPPPNGQDAPQLIIVVLPRRDYEVLDDWGGGRMMGGSLDLLAHAFPDSHLRLDRIGALFGERGFGPVSQMTTGVLEGALFASCVAGAMVLARRSLSRETR